MIQAVGQTVLYGVFLNIICKYIRVYTRDSCNCYISKGLKPNKIIYNVLDLNNKCIKKFSIYNFNSIYYSIN